MVKGSVVICKTISAIAAAEKKKPLNSTFRALTQVKVKPGKSKKHANK